MIPRRALLAGASALALGGCVEPSVVVVRQAYPNPFRGQARFGVLPLSFEGLVVNERSETEWIRDRNVEAWLADKAAMNEAFALELMNEATRAGVAAAPVAPDANLGLPLVRAHVVSIEPGVYAGFFAKGSKTKLDLELVGPGGRSLDLVSLESVTEASVVMASIGARLRNDAGILGQQAGRYLGQRVTQA